MERGSLVASMTVPCVLLMQAAHLVDRTMEPDADGGEEWDNGRCDRSQRSGQDQSGPLLVSSLQLIYPAGGGKYLDVSRLSPPPGPESLLVRELRGTADMLALEVCVSS